MSDQPAKQLFLLAQTFSKLRHLDDERERRMHVCGQPGDEKSKANPETQDTWEEIPERTTVLNMALSSEPAQRVAIVCDAGLGKSTNMQWLEYCLADIQASRSLPLLIRLDDRVNPDDASTLSMQLIEDEFHKPGTLLSHLATEIIRAIGEEQTEANHARHLSALKRYQSQARISLLIDGLDHAISQRHFVDKLIRIIDSPAWCQCPVWIAGRAYAFNLCWEKLFSQPKWQFLRVNPLAEPEIRLFMTQNDGGDYYDELIESSELLCVPRLLNLICQIIRREQPNKKLTQEGRTSFINRLGLNTRADVYYKAYFEAGKYDDPDTQGLLAQGLVGYAKKLGLSSDRDPLKGNLKERISRMGDLIGAVAFYMMALNSDADEPEPVTNGVDLEHFKKEVRDGKRWPSLGDHGQFEKDLDLLEAVNNHTLESLIFRESDETRWLFHDRTTMAFFAAHFVLRNGTPEQLAVLNQWIIGKSGKRLSGFDEFWRFAAEMPSCFEDDERWKMVFETCYEPPHKLAGRPDYVQWTRRMIYFTFEQMQKRSPKTVIQWRGVWLELRKGKGTPRQFKAYNEIVKGFRECPPKGKDTPIEFWLGKRTNEQFHPLDNIPRKVVITPFKMHQYPTTNHMYELFDPNHAEERNSISSDNTQPVILVSFWDAWCFATWTGNRLPKEDEWEFACRGGTETPYYFGDAMHKSLANNCGSCPLWEIFELYSREPMTTWVGYYEWVNPHPWGLCDVHGNVSEWCDSNWLKGGVDRVCRGGSYCTSSDCATAAYRRRSEPDIKRNDVGFRLAAGPIEEPSMANEVTIREKRDDESHQGLMHRLKQGLKKFLFQSRRS